MAKSRGGGDGVEQAVHANALRLINGDRQRQLVITAERQNAVAARQQPFAQAVAALWMDAGHGPP